MSTPSNQPSPPRVLTIAGLDPSGGAGIIADIEMILAFGCAPVAVITSVTFQNSSAFHGAVHQTAESIRSQVTAIIEEHEVAAVKIGMLPTAEIVSEVARLIREKDLPAPVVDPVMRSTSGHQLIEEGAIEALLSDLLPLARVVTPNIPEAEHLSRLEIASEEQMREAAARIRVIGSRAVLVKGGHLSSTQASGLLISSQGVAENMSARSRDAFDILDDDGRVTAFRGVWIDSTNLRGTGCMLSSAIAAGLAHKKSLEESVRTAKEFVADRIRQAQNQSIRAMR